MQNILTWIRVNVFNLPCSSVALKIIVGGRLNKKSQSAHWARKAVNVGMQVNIYGVRSIMCCTRIGSSTLSYRNEK